MQKRLRYEEPSALLNRSINEGPSNQKNAKCWLMDRKQLRNRDQRAFSAIGTNADLLQVPEESIMKIEKTRWSRGRIAAYAVSAILLGSASVYAENADGVWSEIRTDRELTAETADFSGEEAYAVHDATGSKTGSGCEIAYHGLRTHRHPMTAEEIADEIADRITLNENNGRYYLYWRCRELEITDDFKDEDYVYLKLADGKDAVYVTASKYGFCCASPDHWPIPGEDF